MKQLSSFLMMLPFALTGASQAMAIESKVLPIVPSKIVVEKVTERTRTQIGEARLTIEGQLKDRTPIRSTLNLAYVEGRLAPNVVCEKWRCQARIQTDRNFLRTLVLIDTNRDGKLDFQRTLPVALISPNGELKLLPGVKAEAVLVRETPTLNDLTLDPSVQSREYTAISFKVN